jgi:hypothetical protein
VLRQIIDAQRLKSAGAHVQRDVCRVYATRA